MDDTDIVTTYGVLDDILKAWGFEEECRATGHGAEMLTVAVVALASGVYTGRYPGQFRRAASRPPGFDPGA
jgi:hypothetical protein